MASQRSVTVGARGRGRARAGVVGPLSSTLRVRAGVVERGASDAVVARSSRDRGSSGGGGGGRRAAASLLLCAAARALRLARRRARPRGLDRHRRRGARRHRRLWRGSGGGRRQQAADDAHDALARADGAARVRGRRDPQRERVRGSDGSVSYGRHVFVSGSSARAKCEVAMVVSRTGVTFCSWILRASECEELLSSNLSDGSVASQESHLSVLHN